MSSTLALVALVIAAIPFIAIGCVLAAIALFIAFIIFIENARLRDICFAVIAAFDFIVLVSIWLASKAYAIADPAAWEQAQDSIWSFTIVFLLPTVVLAYMFYGDESNGDIDKKPN